MKKIIPILSMWAALGSACGIYDGYRPEKTVTFQPQLGGNRITSVEYVREDRRVELDLYREDETYKVTVPDHRWAGMMVLVFPIPTDPARRQLLIFNEDESPVARVSVKDFLSSRSKNIPFRILDIEEAPPLLWDPSLNVEQDSDGNSVNPPGVERTP